MVAGEKGDVLASGVESERSEKGEEGASKGVSDGRVEQKGEEEKSQKIEDKNSQDREGKMVVSVRVEVESFDLERLLRRVVSLPERFGSRGEHDVLDIVILSSKKKTEKTRFGSARRTEEEETRRVVRTHLVVKANQAPSPSVGPKTRPSGLLFVSITFLSSHLSSTSLPSGSSFGSSGSSRYETTRGAGGTRE